MKKQKRQPMNQSGNPITVLVKYLGFKGKTAVVIEWVVFGVSMFIIGGILIGGQ